MRGPANGSVGPCCLFGPTDSAWAQSSPRVLLWAHAELVGPRRKSPPTQGRSHDQANFFRGLSIRKRNEGDFPRAAGPENWRGGAPNPSPSIAKGTGAAARLPFSVAQPPRRARRGPRGRRPEIGPDAPHARSAAAPMPLGHGNAIRHAHAPLRPAWSAPWPPHARPRATGRMGEWGHTHAAPAPGLQHSGQG